MNRTDRVLHNPDRSCATYSVARAHLTFWSRSIYRPTFKDALSRSEEEMLSLRPYTALSTAAARPFNRPSDWRRSCVAMPEHQITGEQGPSLPLG